MISEIVSYHWTVFVQGVEEAARQAGYHVILCNTADNAQLETEYLKDLRERFSETARVRLDEMAALLEQLRQDPDQRDALDRLATHFHGLAGMGTTCGFPRLSQLGVAVDDAVRALPPLPYLDFLGLHSDAALMLTDSGGLQEEACTLGVPCVTLRDNTERPVTITEGTNVLAGSDPKVVRATALRALETPPAGGRVPRGWDGRAAERIVAHLAKSFGAT